MRMTDRRTKEAMKESGWPDLKARRKAHMLPMMGQPMSPGGRWRRFSPRPTSCTHSCSRLKPPHTATSPIAAAVTVSTTPHAVSITSISSSPPCTSVFPVLRHRQLTLPA